MARGSRALGLGFGSALPRCTRALHSSPGVLEVDMSWLLNGRTLLSDLEITEKALVVLLCVMNNVLRNILVVSTAVRLLGLFLININKGIISNNNSAKASGCSRSDIGLIETALISLKLFTIKTFSNNDTDSATL